MRLPVIIINDCWEYIIEVEVKLLPLSCNGEMNCNTFILTSSAISSAVSNERFKTLTLDVAG